MTYQEDVNVPRETWKTLDAILNEKFKILKGLGSKVGDRFELKSLFERLLNCICEMRDEEQRLSSDTLH